MYTRLDHTDLKDEASCMHFQEKLIRTAQGSGVLAVCASLVGITSTQSLTHMYRENDTYSHRNHTS